MHVHVVAHLRVVEGGDKLLLVIGLRLGVIVQPILHRLLKASPQAVPPSKVRLVVPLCVMCLLGPFRNPLLEDVAAKHVPVPLG